MFFKELIVPEGVSVEITGNTVKVSGPKGQLEKTLQTTREIKIEKLENRIKVSSESEKRKTKTLVGTILAHMRNMIDGVTKGFTYRLKVVYSHFPITVKVEGDKVLVQNFLGERIPRIAKIVRNTEVKVDGTDIAVTGIDVDDVSRTAANIEQSCRIVGYDKKRFMDGVYLVSKGE